MASTLPMFESVFTFSVAVDRFNNTAHYHLLQKIRCSGRLYINGSHHITPPKDSLTGECLAEFQNMAYSFGMELRLNIRFQPLNVRFCCTNVRFPRLFERAADVQCPVMKRMILIQQQISQKQFQIFCRLMDTVFQIIVVGSNKGVAEVPGILSKNVVGHIKAKRPQILYEEHRRRPGIALRKYVNLPQPRYSLPRSHNPKSP